MQLSAVNSDTSKDVSFEELRHLSVKDSRSVIRANRYAGHTAGIGLGRVQGNLAIMPAEYALDFARYCQRNPKPCPMVGVSDTGDPMMRTLGRDIDIRTDLPLYNQYENGDFLMQRRDIRDVWRDDFVAFVIGCSFSFEEALIADGIRLRHIEEDTTVSMYKTDIQTVPSGKFGGPMVVSMRPLRREDAMRAMEISARFPHAHGRPVHFGDPATIGIRNLMQPDWGDPTEVQAGEIPVFWACGVTSQVAVRQAKLPISITHAPGRMLVTDIPSWDAGLAMAPAA